MDVESRLIAFFLILSGWLFASCAGDPRNVYNHQDMAEQSFYGCSPSPEVLPKLISGRVPTYPPRRMAAGQPGFAAVEFDISETGIPSNIKRVETSHSAFYASTRAALLEWTFEPARISSQPVSVRCKYTQAYGYRVIKKR